MEDKFFFDKLLDLQKIINNIYNKKDVKFSKWITRQKKLERFREKKKKLYEDS